MKSIKVIACICAMGGAAFGGEFVPFVIPAKSNPQSLIAASPGEVIAVSSARLTAGEHFEHEGKRVRLWGVNLSFGANLPARDEAADVAARLAAAGVNTVRMHHLDTARWPRGIWDARTGRGFEPEALDRLDYFINELAKRGIWVNLNLHVGRTHSEYVGAPKTNRDYDKMANLLAPELIEAQREYARQILTRVNRYRNVRWADDPAVAIVEITNENSFFMWGAEEMLRTLPDYYAKILREQFNAWLKAKHGSDEKLKAAWSMGVEAPGDNMLENSRLVVSNGRVDGWNVEQHEGCRATAETVMYKGKEALKLSVVKRDQTAWHLQFNQRQFAVEGGRYYTVMFEATGEGDRDISLTVGQGHDPWRGLGLSRQVRLSGEWKQYTFGFTATESDTDARISISFGNADSPVYLANVRVHPGGRVGLGAGESVEEGTVGLFADNESAPRIEDRMVFLAETEKAFFDGMRRYVKQELGCGALVTGTIVFGPLGLYTQSDMDFIDGHSYWQHPRFPNRPWDPGDWLIDQKAMVDFPQEATLFRLAAERLRGKPYTVTEYNHPAPLDSQAECVPLIASFAAAHDWDGVWLYTYSHSTGEWEREHINSFFDVDTNPAKWGFMRAGTAMFRDSGIAALGHRTVWQLSLQRALFPAAAQLHLRSGTNMFAAVSSRMAGMTWEKLLSSETAATLGSYPGHAEMGRTLTTMTWDVAGGKGFYAVRAGAARVYVGYSGRFSKGTSGEVEVKGPEFVAMTITALDGASRLDNCRHVLISACGRCENTGMVFSEDRRTVGRNWGTGPAQIETVEATVKLPPGQWTCKVLAPDGTAKADVPTDGGVVRLGPEFGTMWYVLTRN